MTLLFKTRFLKSIGPFSFYLNTIGIFLHQTNSPFKWKQFVCFILSFTCFAITLQAGLHVFIEKTMLDIPYAFSGIDSSRGINFTSKHHSRMDAFSVSLAGTSSFVCGTATSLFLVVTSPATIRLFCISLETMDRLSKRLDLKYLRRYSIVAVTWTAIMVTLQCGWISFWWLRNPEYFSLNWFSRIQKLIETLQGLNYTLSAAWIYILCARTIVIYYLHIADKLQQLVERNDYCADEIFRIVKMFRHLSQATRLLHRRFEFILLINCYCLIIKMIYLMYYVTRYNNVLGFFTSMYDWLCLIEAVCRLLFICHSADSIRNSSLQSISILRLLRDDDNFITKSADRMQLTLFIIELYNCEKDVTLLGVMQLSKRIILKAVETALTFYIIIYQFQIGWSQLPAAV